MDTGHLVWSGTACDFPGAGLYSGLAGHSDHCVIGARLSKRQLRVFPGATVCVVDGQSWPAYYYALRDPSAVGVRMLDQPPLDNGMRHVNLSFRFERRPPPDPAATLLGHPTTSAVFVMTIGLPIQKEEEIFQRVLADHQDQTWAELHDRLCDFGRRRRGS